LNVELSSLSPVSFLFAKEGDFVAIREKIPNLREFRGTLESARVVFLVFKGQTKVGMIPPIFLEQHDISDKLSRGRIVKIDKEKKKIIIELII